MCRGTQVKNHSSNPIHIRNRISWFVGIKNNFKIGTFIYRKNIKLPPVPPPPPLAALSFVVVYIILPLKGIGGVTGGNFIFFRYINVPIFRNHPRATMATQYVGQKSYTEVHIYNHLQGHSQSFSRLLSY